MKKDTGCDIKRSGVSPTNCSFIEQQRKSNCGIATNDAKSVEKVRNSKIEKINGNPERNFKAVKM